MARKIDIELTSRRDDGAWTWRAPGAKQPRGLVEGTLLPDAVAVGDVLRAEAEFELEGITIVSVSPAEHKEGKKERKEEQVIELLGPRRPTEGVSVTYAGGRRRDERGRREGGERGRREGSERGRREGSERGRPATEGQRARGRAAGAPAGAPPEGERPRPERRPDGSGGRPRAGGGSAPGGRNRERPAARQRGLHPGTTYRNAALAELRPEQLPVAEQLLRGGIPAVRQAINEQNGRARAEGRAEVAAEPLLAMAEELLPKMNLATWKDRAVAARTAAQRDLPLRDLRSVVASASTVALDDEGRELATGLREALNTRLTALRDGWVSRLTAALDEGRVEDALRVSSRPPEPATRVPAELAVRMAEGASAALAPELPAQRWLSLLQAVVDSPVRRTVRPAGLPADADEELVAAARHAAGQVPGLAKLLGLPIPPPPGPRRPTAAARRP